MLTVSKVFEPLPLTRDQPRSRPQHNRRSPREGLASARRARIRQLINDHVILASFWGEPSAERVHSLSRHATHRSALCQGLLIVSQDTTEVEIKGDETSLFFPAVCSFPLSFRFSVCFSFFSYTTSSNFIYLVFSVLIPGR